MKIVHVNLAKYLFKMLSISDYVQLVTDHNISVNWKHIYVRHICRYKCIVNHWNAIYLSLVLLSYLNCVCFCCCCCCLNFIWVVCNNNKNRKSKLVSQSECEWIKWIMVDWRKAFSLISSQDHCQRSLPSRISDTLQAGFDPAQNLSSGLNEVVQ